MENLAPFKNPGFLCLASLLSSASVPVGEMWAKPHWISMQKYSAGFNCFSINVYPCTSLWKVW